MSLSLGQLRIMYDEGSLSKEEYIVRSHAEVHSKIFQYANELGRTEIRKVELTSQSVLMTTVDNVVIEVDSCDYRTAPIEAINFCNYEPSESNFIRSLAPFINTMIDIGANIGWYSMMVAKLNKNAQVHAFEPIPKTYNGFARNVFINGLTNVTGNNFGLGERSERLSFFYYSSGTGNASLRNLAGNPDTVQIDCEMRTLDEYAATKLSSCPVDFIKCDVEGAELFTLRGGLNTIKKSMPIILIELLRKWSRPFGYHPNDVVKLLRELGYSAFTLNENKSLEEIHYIDNDTVATNFVFIHQKSNLRARAEETFLL